MQGWERKFRDRIQRFEQEHPSSDDGFAVSIKLRADSGCYHRSCCREAYRLIDDYLRRVPLDNSAQFEEHESGPEVLAYLALGTAGLTVAKSVIDLIVTIIKARAEGRQKGDGHSEPVELIIRRVVRNDELREERILRFHGTDDVDPAKIGKLLDAAAKRIVDDDEAGC